MTRDLEKIIFVVCRQQPINSNKKSKSLSDIEKLRLVDSILADLDRPDPEIDRIWAEEARKRWDAYKAGRLRSVSYEEVMSKYRDQ